MKMNMKKVFCAALATLMICCSFTGCNAKAPEESELDLHLEQAGHIDATAAPTEPAVKEMSVSDLLKEVNGLKDDLETIMDDIEAEEITSAENKVQGLTRKTAVIRNSLSATMTNLGDSMPSLNKELNNIQGLLDLVDTVAETILDPLVDQFKMQPFSGFQSGEGVSTKLLCEYLDFAETLMPEIETLVEQAASVDLSLVDSDGEIAGYLESIGSLLEMYHKNEGVFDRLKAMFGGNEDRVYLIAAQNSSEIRSSGGFPGAVGVIRITDGVLVMEDFKKVYNVLSSYTPAKANVTTLENTLFHYGLQAPRDADHCPDFERVAYIWSLGYEAGMGEPVDGVISMTPVVVQRLLNILDEEIKLFDGTILNGENATKGLQYDLYYKYYSTSAYTQGRDRYVDQLFADAAKKTLNLMLDNLSFSDFSAYLDMLGACVEDRTFMLWMKDDAEQNIIRSLGWNGGLNTDPEKPQAGVYYTSTDASKMGWFLNMDAEIGEPIKNEDGSSTYPMTVTFYNVITEDEIRNASWYIIGVNSRGGIIGSAYFFAPAGGTISDFAISNGAKLQMNTYHDLELGYMPPFEIDPGELVTVTYNVTTAPGVETPLGLSMTPTVQDYR